MVLEEADILDLVDFLAARDRAIPLEKVTLLPPIDRQEVWAAGVTYKRSQAARMEESEAAADCYDRVYSAERPEIFFKATPNRVAAPGAPLLVFTPLQAFR